MAKDTKKTAEKKEKNTKKPEQKVDWQMDILPKLNAGTTVKVHQKIQEKGGDGQDKERTQIFEGVVLSRKGGKQKNATITVRKVAAGGIGVEKIFPIFSPTITNIELVKAAKVKQARPYYLRDYKKTLSEKKA